MIGLIEVEINQAKGRARSAVRQIEKHMAELEAKEAEANRAYLARPWYVRMWLDKPYAKIWDWKKYHNGLDVANVVLRASDDSKTMLVSVEAWDLLTRWSVGLLT